MLSLLACQFVGVPLHTASACVRGAIADHSVQDSSIVDMCVRAVRLCDMCNLCKICVRLCAQFACKYVSQPQHVCVGGGPLLRAQCVQDVCLRAQPAGLSTQMQVCVRALCYTIGRVSWSRVNSDSEKLIALAVADSLLQRSTVVAQALRRAAMPADGWTKMTSEERRLAQEWYSQNKKPSEIAELLNRDTSTLTRLLCMKKAAKKQGRPEALTDAAVDLLERRLDELIVKADGRRTVTADWLMKATKCKASKKSVLKALHKRNIYFRKLREKPVLTPEDVKARLAFAKKYRNKTKDWWLRNVHAFIDGKHFQVYLNGQETVHSGFLLD